MSTPPSFNPLDYTILSASLRDALMASPLIPLGAIEPFYGYGVYALFYEGDFPAYSRLAGVNRDNPGSWPIYIGKSSPSTRTGLHLDPNDIGGRDAGQGLYSRVSGDHRASIENATNLEIADFSTRLLVLSYVWVPLAETSLIAAYEPVWNAYLSGFGNHAPGGGRTAGRLSKWDELHPGRGREPRAGRGFDPEYLSRQVEAQLEDTWQRKFRRADE